MKTLEWFASFPYENFEIVIPKSLIVKSTYVLEEGKSRLSPLLGLEAEFMDRAVERVFSTKIQKAAITELVIQGERKFLLLTGAVPQAQQIHYGEFRLFGGALGEVLRGRGIIACRFLEHRIQYLVDIEKIMQTSEGK